jgi:hypothetical protein
LLIRTIFLPNPDPTYAKHPDPVSDHVPDPDPVSEHAPDPDPDPVSDHAPGPDPDQNRFSAKLLENFVGGNKYIHGFSVSTSFITHRVPRHYQKK